MREGENDGLVLLDLLFNEILHFRSTYPNIDGIARVTGDSKDVIVDFVGHGEDAFVAVFIDNGLATPSIEGWGVNRSCN